MAISVGGGNGRGRRGPAPLAEINVTPFVDVVLVLLIIFMLTAHVMESGMDVNVPETRHVKESTRELPIVTISKTGDVYLGKEEVNIHQLGDTIHQKFSGQQAVYVQADQETPYNPIAQVISELGEAKLQVSLVTRPVDSSNVSSGGGRSR